MWQIFGGFSGDFLFDIYNIYNILYDSEGESDFFWMGLTRIRRHLKKKTKFLQIGVASLIWERTGLLVSLLFFCQTSKKKTCCSLVTFQKNG